MEGMAEGYWENDISIKQVGKDGISEMQQLQVFFF